MDVVKVGLDWSLSGDFWIKSVLLLCLVSEANSISSNLFSTPAFAFVEIQPLHQKDPCGSALTTEEEAPSTHDPMWESGLLMGKRLRSAKDLQ